MILVTGGAYQGKSAFARTLALSGDAPAASGATCEREDIFTVRILYGFHEYVRRFGEEWKRKLESRFPESCVMTGEPEQKPAKGCEADEACASGMIQKQNTDEAAKPEDPWRWCVLFAKLLAGSNPQLILETNELGCGVVPVDRDDRFWRECTGRLCCEIAREAEEVYRVICGIGMPLKQPGRQ